MPAPLILVVDDSLTVRMDLVEALEAAGFSTVQAATLDEARRRLRGEAIAVMILDVVLPDGDGIEFLAEVKNDTTAPTPFILLLSSEAEVRDRIRGMSVGADDYIGKPYDVNHVVLRSRELVSSRSPGHDARPILVIDDSKTFREQLRTSLEEANYSVVVAASGEEGLRLAAGLRPQAILVDHMMPGLDGCSVIRQVRLDSALRTTPCVLLTASEGERVELRALDAGADAFVRKEDIEVVLARLVAVLRGRTAQPAAAAGLLSPKRILAVDDSPTFLDTLASVLQSEGYDVVLARSGDECIAMLGAQQIDCILLDLQMPGTDGLQACRHIKAAPGLREIPLIILTGRDDRPAMIDALGSGADDFIPKSSDFEVLKARVRAQLRRKQFEDEHRDIRERLMRADFLTAEARAERELLRTRALLVEELEAKNEELSRAYAELQNAQQHLIQSAKMASLGELVAGVAHELNNPLAFVRSHVETVRRSLKVLDGVLQSEGQSEHQAAWVKAGSRLVEIDRGLERMSELVIKLRTFSRLDEGELKYVDLAESLESVLTILGHRCKNRIAITTDMAEPRHIECYASLLNQALMNLIANAIDAVPGLGTIHIASSWSGDDVVIRIADSGTGIPEHLRQRVMEPFFTTKPVGQGTGLGLSITYSIVQKHGGTLDLLPRPGGGTEAVLRIPGKPNSVH